MSRKPRPGSSLRGSLITSAGWISDVTDAMQDYKLRRKLGTGSEPPRTDIPTDKIRVQLSGGGPYAIGTPLEIGAPAFTTVSREKNWHAAAVRAGNRAIGIALEPASTSKYTWCQLSGTCAALVDVDDVQHTHAYCLVGAASLTSGWGGPFEIVSQAATAGEQTLLVRFQPLYRRRVKTNATLLANNFADCNFYGGSTLGTVIGTGDVYFNWMKGGVASIASGVEGWATWDDGISAWILDSAECT